MTSSQIQKHQKNKKIKNDKQQHGDEIGRKNEQAGKGISS